MSNTGKTIFTVVLAVTMGIGVQAYAATANWQAQVNQILLDDQFFGGCMAAVTPPPSEQLSANCNTAWVTFSCDGTFNPRSTANAKLSAAQLAYVAGTPVQLTVTDSKKHNGHCFATRIQNESGSSHGFSLLDFGADECKAQVEDTTEQPIALPCSQFQRATKSFPGWLIR
ncbi:MAG: hypothetical protein U5K56_02295 [Halioglobus sp.]|nr:hypothetical protein [Halioglobus sp.]